MPGWNECGIYDERCRNRTCDHPTNPKNQTNDGTKNDVTGSVSVPQSESVSVGTDALTGLTRDELWSLWRAVRDTLPTRGNEAPLRTAWAKLNDALEL